MNIPASRSSDSSGASSPSKEGSSPSKDDALMLLAYEMRTSLAVIVGSADTLLWGREMLTAPQVDVALSAIRRHGERMMRFSEDLIDAARAGGLDLRRGPHPQT